MLKSDFTPMDRQYGIGLMELLISLILFMICVVALTNMQMKSGMESLDNQQRSAALWKARGLIDRISANKTNAAIVQYQSSIAQSDTCPKQPVKRCEPSSASSTTAQCTSKEMAVYDVWSVFCETETGLSSQLIEHSASLSCTGACTPSSNMTLRIAWVSKYSDSDNRRSNTVKDGDGNAMAANQDYIALDFRP